jgi:transcriptional regulator with PAS, ATPase and Fis domain
MIGRSASMLDAFSLARRAAMHFHTILITGPPGTGKELMARALHRMSPAGGRPFIVCNCAAIEKTLFESELFGQARGSPTGSTMDPAGFFDLADDGTLFLDEIGEIPLKLQARFLRALQRGERWSRRMNFVGTFSAFSRFWNSKYRRWPTARRTCHFSAGILWNASPGKWGKTSGA